jgi:uncharacterized protein YbbC (DUF1343 family)
MRSERAAAIPPQPAAAAASLGGVRLGIDTLLAEHRAWLTRGRIGLVSHAAAVDAAGLTSAERLWRDPEVRLAALFGPEHGFRVAAGAGESVRTETHPAWGIPLYSLYGDTRRPTSDMLACVDTLVFDLQDLGARPYTYVSTLRYLLEAATGAGKAVIVADRPIPLPRVVDGPVLDPAFESFVAAVRMPMAYGMTPGEAARWLAADLELALDLRVAPMTGYARPITWPLTDRPWTPPSPGIRSLESACAYTATVAGEALGALDYGARTSHPFQVLGAPWLQGRTLADALADLTLPGVAFDPCRYTAASERHHGAVIEGVRIRVVDGATFRPLLTAVSLLATIQALGGKDRLWLAPGTRPEFFDKLFGTDRVRLALLDGLPGAAIAADWEPGLAAFRLTRAATLLYPLS